jgi:hypothetical protein
MTEFGLKSHHRRLISLAWTTISPCALSVTQFNSSPLFLISELNSPLWQRLAKHLPLLRHYCRGFILCRCASCKISPVTFQFLPPADGPIKIFRPHLCLSLTRDCASIYPCHSMHSSSAQILSFCDVAVGTTHLELFYPTCRFPLCITLFTIVCLLCEPRVTLTTARMIKIKSFSLSTVFLGGKALYIP